MTVRPGLRLTGSGITGLGPDVRPAGPALVDFPLVDSALVARLHIDLLRVASAACPRHS
ncbi:putative leader peptide [Frankia sp. CiP3]|uniref:putative leader peptide n=1 Tax=Frankia sp. CiP3 TaxID=2880971 RepID=UPI0035AC264B